MPPLPARRRAARRVSPRCVPVVVVAAVTLLALAGCSRDEEREASQPTRARTAAVTVVDGTPRGAAWVAEDRVHLSGGTSIKLAAPVNGGLIATLAPVAVAAPTDDDIAYNAWRGRRPILRIRDDETRRDIVLDEGAHSVAWARDGAVAYFKALRPDLGEPLRYLGHVVVRASPQAGARRWTPAAGRYVVAAWADDRVLFYRLRMTFPDLLVLDGQRRQRVLAAGSALVALSPDGRQAFVSRWGASPPLVRVMDVTTGAEVARLRVGKRRGNYVVASGSWVGDLVFAPTTSGITVFRVADGAIEFVQTVRAGSAFPLGLSEPQASPDGRKVVAWGEVERAPRQTVSQAALVECDRTTFRCIRAAVAASAAPPRPLYNPSRP